MTTKPCPNLGVKTWWEEAPITEKAKLLSTIKLPTFLANREWEELDIYAKVEIGDYYYPQQ